MRQTTGTRKSPAELCRREKPWYLVGSGWQAKVERVKQ